MARIKLTYPDDVFDFSTTLTVRFDDINIGNHLANERLVALLGEARSQFLASRGLTDTGGSDQPGSIVADLAVSFRAEARLRDVLRIEVGVVEPNRYGGDLVYRVTRPLDRTVIAVAKTGIVFFDYAAGRIAPAPRAFAGGELLVKDVEQRHTE